MIARKLLQITFCLLLTSQAPAQMFEGCPSEEIRQAFTEFGNTGQMPPDLGKWLNNPVAQYVQPWKPFDNVDFVGICWVSAWLVHTDDGIVLIDTLYGQFVEQLQANIEAVGVDLEDIRYVLITHGHFDHAAGAATLKPLLPNAQFVMTQAGWDGAREDARKSQGTSREWTMIEPEIVAADGQTITLGNNTFSVIETPGHTWGTASYLYDVQDNGETFRAVTVGGLGLNAVESAEQVQAYIDSVDKIRGLVTDPDINAQVHLSTHGFSNNLPEKRERLAERKAGEPNVFVDQEGILDQLAGLREGAVERLEKERAK